MNNEKISHCGSADDAGGLCADWRLLNGGEVACSGGAGGLLADDGAAARVG